VTVLSVTNCLISLVFIGLLLHFDRLMSRRKCCHQLTGNSHITVTALLTARYT